MRCFLCKIALVVPTFSIRSQNQPEADVTNGYAHFCSDCTTRIEAAIDDSSRFTRRGLDSHLRAHSPSHPIGSA